MPGGDIAKGIAKSAQKAVAKTAVKVGAELADDAAKVIKGSTAAAADGLSSAKKTAGKVHAPRGPPAGNRPGGFRKSTVQNAWNTADDGLNGGKLCPTCGKEVVVPPGQGTRQSPRDWDIDHQPPWSKREKIGKERKGVLDDYNSGTRLECPTCNRGRGAKPAP